MRARKTHRRLRASISSISLRAFVQVAMAKQRTSLPQM